jgi:hypothetical protein
LSQKIQSLTFANAFGAKVEVGSKSCCWVSKFSVNRCIDLACFYLRYQNVHGFPRYSCTIIFKKSLIFCEFSHCINSFSLSILLCNNVVIGKRIYVKTAYCRAFHRETNWLMCLQYSLQGWPFYSNMQTQVHVGKCIQKIHAAKFQILPWYFGKLYIYLMKRNLWK